MPYSVQVHSVSTRTVYYRKVYSVESARLSQSWAGGRASGCVARRPRNGVQGCEWQAGYHRERKGYWRTHASLNVRARTMTSPLLRHRAARFRALARHPHFARSVGLPRVVKRYHSPKEPINLVLHRELNWNPKCHILKSVILKYQYYS